MEDSMRQRLIAAEKRLKEKDPNTDLKRAQLALQRSLIRLEVLGK